MHSVGGIALPNGHTAAADGKSYVGLDVSRIGRDDMEQLVPL